MSSTPAPAAVLELLKPITWFAPVWAFGCGLVSVGLCYEGLPWFTGAAVVSAVAPDGRIVLLALLYSFGAHGIMTLNDFKAIEGDRQLGIRSLPVQLGPERAARLACVVMASAQLAVVAALVWWGRPYHALLIGVFLVVQLGLMARFLTDPRGRAAWYNATGAALYVLGMLAAAFALQARAAG